MQTGQQFLKVSAVTSVTIRRTLLVFEDTDVHALLHLRNWTGQEHVFDLDLPGRKVLAEVACDIGKSGS